MTLEIVSASAGTGKTTWLTRSIVQALQSGIAPERVMATTFTRAAAHELGHRVRSALLAEGMTQEANAVTSGLLGTINSTVGEILQVFCWEAGLSPRMDVIEPADGAVLLQAALSEAVDAAMAPDKAAALERLGLLGPPLVEEVRRLVDALRANAVSVDDLPEMARRSAGSLLQYFPSPMGEAQVHDLEGHLREAVARAVRELPNRSVIKTGAASVERVQRLDRHSGLWPWSDWVALTKLNFGKDNRDLSLEIAEYARHVLAHPTLRQDIEYATALMFRLARATAGRFQELKQERGLIDFTDQEALTYQLLVQDDVRSRLAERIEAIWVDEFQDSSPLELAVLQELGGISQQAWWVGDPKQAIYGFRGTDPELMNGAVRALASAGGTHVLGQSYRSRRELVEIVNAIFSPAFENQQISPDHVRLEAHRDTAAGAAEAFAIWHLSTGGSGGLAAVAGQIAQILAQPGSTVVSDPETGAWRPIRGGDIAILCRTNSQCWAIAEHLNALGVRGSVGQDGLLETPEVGYALAALRLLWDPGDRLALAELVHLGTDLGGGGQWLAQWLQDPEGFAGYQDARVLALREGRAALSQMTLTEAFDRSLLLAEAWQVVRGWPAPDVRSGNLEKMRAIAAAFEERAHSLRVAPTVPAFLGYLQEVQADDKNEWNRQSTSHDEQAVTVMTYHKAKGLEWPMVVLTFNEEKAANPFGVHVESSQALSASRPLDGRWIRYWPWPFGRQEKDTGLVIGEELREAEHRVKQELTRLMYVAMTRARDYMIWAYRADKAPAGLTSLENAAGRPVLTLPVQPGDPLMVMDHAVTVPVHTVAPPDAGQVQPSDDVTIWAPWQEGAELFSRVPRRVLPSKMAAPPGVIEEQREIGPRVALSGRPDMTQVGELVHAFLAASAHYPESQWLGLAEKVVSRWNMLAIQPGELPGIARRFRQFMTDRYPESQEHVEWPVGGVQQNQCITGVIDSLWLGPAGVAIVDHKTFPGGEEQWNEKALAYLGQLGQYQDLLEAAGTGPVRELWIHFPVVGRMIRVRRQ